MVTVFRFCGGFLLSQCQRSKLETHSPQIKGSLSSYPVSFSGVYQLRVCPVMVPFHVHSKHRAKGQERLRAAWCPQPCDREDTSKGGANPFYPIDMQLQRASTQGFLTSLQIDAVWYFFSVYAAIYLKNCFP